MTTKETDRILYECYKVCRNNGLSSTETRAFLNYRISLIKVVNFECEYKKELDKQNKM